jgi:hypothetical protein
VLQGAFVDFTTFTNFTKLLFVRQIRLSDAVLSASEEDILLHVGSCPAAEAEKLIDKNKNDIIGNSDVDRSRQISGVNPLRA